MHGNCVEVLTPMSWKGDTCSWFGGDELCQSIRRREFDQSHDAWINAVDTKNKGTRCGGMVDWIVWMNDTSRKWTVSLAFNHSHGYVEPLVGNNKNRGLFADREASIFASPVCDRRIARLEIQTGINRLSIALLFFNLTSAHPSLSVRMYHWKIFGRMIRKHWVVESTHSFYSKVIGGETARLRERGKGTMSGSEKAKIWGGSVYSLVSLT